MPLPQVVIVGRPNVGKSSLLNWLARRRIAIVDDKEGVTRDRVAYLMHEHQRFFEIVDTGGIGIIDDDNLSKQVEEQIDAAIESADLILFVVDTRAGILPMDEEVARRLRYVDKPILLVANKSDHEGLDTQADEFLQLRRGKLIRISTRENRNREILIKMIVNRLPPAAEDEADTAAEPVMKVAIVGRRNTGKSTFVNTLAKAERMIVSEVPGTTRDSVDVRFELDGKQFMAIDTPGLKRSKSIRTDIEFYSLHRAQRSVRRADVVLLFFDCTQRLSKVDKQLCHYVAEQFKPCIFVVNKWDLLYGQMPTERWVSYLRDNFPTMWHVPIAFITGQTGKNVKALLNHAQMLFKQSLDRVKTAELNRLVRAALENHPPPMHGMLRPKIFYATQVGTQPPTIVLVCNEPNAFQAGYQRYLLGVLRDYLKFGEIPIKLYLKKRAPRDKKDEVKYGESEPETVTVEFEDEEGSIFDDDVLAKAGPDDETSSDIYGDVLDEAKLEEEEE